MRAAIRIPIASVAHVPDRRSPFTCHQLLLSLVVHLVAWLGKCHIDTRLSMAPARESPTPWSLGTPGVRSNTPLLLAGVARRVAAGVDVAERLAVALCDAGRAYTETLLRVVHTGRGPVLRRARPLVGEVWRGTLGTTFGEARWRGGRGTGRLRARGRRARSEDR